MTNVIELEAVSRQYHKGPLALNQVDLSVRQGGVYGLLGRNGAGKSTMIKIIMAMIHPTGGSVRVFDKDPWSDHAGIKSRIGYLSEDQMLPPYLKIRELFDFFADCYKDTWDRDMAEQMRARFGLDLDRKLGKFSKGQQRQAGLITAVAHRPELLILDEPGGGLDVVVRREFLETIIELLHEHGATVFFSSHYLTDVERIAEHVLILHEGRMLLDSRLDSLHENHCQVLLPDNLAGGVETISRMPECVSARIIDGAYKAVFSLSLEDARDRIAALLGNDAEFQGSNLGLEDVFIALVGGEL